MNKHEVKKAGGKTSRLLGSRRHRPGVPVSITEAIGEGFSTHELQALGRLGTLIQVGPGQGLTRDRCRGPLPLLMRRRQLRCSAASYDVVMSSRLERITSDPTVCHGQPTVRGSRHTVESILELLASGMSNDEILADYEDLDNNDLLAALEIGALSAGSSRVVPLKSA